MRILIFGAGGRTGQMICRCAKAQNYELLSPHHSECDLIHAEHITRSIFNSGAQAVVNAAAVSGLEACLDDPLQAHLVNAVAPATMALACRHTGARFIHLSTDYVLDGRRDGKKDESAKCRPASVYGESKREGELQVAEAYPQSLIMRVSWIMGNPRRPSFVEKAIQRALQGEPLAAIADKWSMPTDAEDIARVVLALLPTAVSGVLHVCSSGEPQSWHSCTALALRTLCERGLMPTMPGITMQKLAQASFFREPRPRHTAMDNSKLLSLGIPMPTAEETLRRITERFLDNQKACHVAPGLLS